MEVIAEGATLRIVGALDGRSTPEVREALYAALEAHDGDVVVDLSDVDRIDLPALTMIVIASRSALRAGHHLVLRGCRRPVLRMMHLAKVARYLSVERPAS